MISKQDALPLAGVPSKSEEGEAVQVMNMHGRTLPRFRGSLICRRCDSCGTRIGVHGEDDNRVVMKCPECQREYVFFERLE